MAEYEIGRAYPAGEVLARIASPRREGPFAIGFDGAVCFAELGATGAFFPSRSRFGWQAESPRTIVETRRPTHLFVRTGDDAWLYVGDGRVTSYRSEGSNALFRVNPPLSRDLWLRLLALAKRDASPPEAAPEREIALLGTDSSTEQRMGALRTFLAGWHGPAGPAKPALVFDLPLPPPLRELHALLVGVSGAIVRNTFVPPAAIERDRERLIFYVENQGVCSWATEERGDDPPVWYRLNDPGCDWQLEAEPLSGFLIQLLIFEAVMGARFGAVASSVAAEVLDALRPLPIGPWRWPQQPMRFYARDGALACVHETGGRVELHAGALSPSSLDFLDEFVDDTWDVVTF